MRFSGPLRRAPVGTGAFKMINDQDDIAGRRASNVASPPRPGADNAALVDRVHRFRLLLRSFGQEAASARREAARLRYENAKLRRRVAELEQN
jgi:hypothetical protein